MDRNQERQRGNDMQQRATGWNQTCGRCSEDKASVYGAPALQTDRPGAPVGPVLREADAAEKRARYVIFGGKSALSKFVH